MTGGASTEVDSPRPWPGVARGPARSFSEHRGASRRTRVASALASGSPPRRDRPTIRYLRSFSPRAAGRQVCQGAGGQGQVSLGQRGRRMAAQYKVRLFLNTGLTLAGASLPGDGGAVTTAHWRRVARQGSRASPRAGAEGGCFERERYDAVRARLLPDLRVATDVATTVGWCSPPRPSRRSPSSSTAWTPWGGSSAAFSRSWSLTTRMAHAIRRPGSGATSGVIGGRTSARREGPRASERALRRACATTSGGPRCGTS